MDTSKFIEKLNSYCPLSLQLTTELLMQIEEQQLVKGSFLLKKGQVADSIWYILEGSVQTYVQANHHGAYHTLWFWQEGDIIYDRTGMFEGTPGTEYLMALEDTIVQGIPYHYIEFLKNKYEELNKILISVQKDHTRVLIDHCFQLKSPAYTRYKNLLKQNPRVFHSAMIKDIASFLGMYPDTLSSYRSD